ncbi:MAG: 30S ribosomal protein S16 [Bacteroidales bacterium]|nr:30S ribosomal protein S16 [Bacteroidales bacterium]MCF6342727.1 30S ribosomal protein S16 [Bacteroidales bacterium]
MATKMRLQRFGKKRSPFYHIVIADGRAPRDGKFIEKIGTYNPIPNPADIKLDFDKALDWLQKGAQPTETVRAILSYKGVLYKNHLIKGMKKGAMSEAEVEVKFQNWLTEKEAKIDAKRSGLLEKDRAERKAILDAETKISEDRAADLAKRKADEIEAQVAEAREAVKEEETDTTEGDTDEPVTKEAVAAKVNEEEAPVTEEKAPEVAATETADEKVEPKEEPKEEVAAETKKEEPKKEAKEETVKKEKEEAKEDVKKETKE